MPHPVESRAHLSNTETLSDFLAERMRARDIDVSIVKLAGRNVPPGTYSDMGDGDEWPAIREKVLAADILVLATPTWMGQHSSIALNDVGFSLAAQAVTY